MTPPPPPAPEAAPAPPRAPAAERAIEALRLPAPPERILLLRPSALGDVGRTVPALVSLKRAFPAAEIDWLVNRPFAPAIAAHPDLHGVVPFDRHRTRSVPALVRRLRARRYDLALDLQGLARTGFLLAASGARVRVTDRAAREGAWLAGNRRIALPHHPHAVDRLLALLDACGVDPVEDLRLYPPPGAAAAATAEREAAGLPSRFLAVAPTARWGCKRWPLGRFAEVARSVAAAGTAVLGLFGPADRGPREAWDAAVRGSGGAPIASLLPSSVGSLMAHLQAAAGLLGNDSASLHLAVGLGTPTVSLFGPTDPAAVGPFRRGVPHAPHAVVRCPNPPPVDAYRRLGDDDRHMRSIPVPAVRDAVGRLLRRDAASDAAPAPPPADADRPIVA